MKFTKANKATFWALLILGMVIGTLAWAVLEKTWLLWGWEFSLAVGPIGFDLDFLAVYISGNPGTLAGVVGGYYLFKQL